MPIFELALAARIAYGKWSVLGLLRGVEQIAKHVLVVGRADGHIRDAIEICQVECTVVCSAVFAHNTCAVDAECHRQVLQCHVVYYFIVSSLQER